MEPNLPMGRFDIFADVNSNGIYDTDVDAIDDKNVYETAGFFVVPELPFGVLTSIIACVFAYFVIGKRRNTSFF